MTEPEQAHRLAPAPGTAEEGPGDTSNETETVRVRAGIETGAMRYVLGVGLLLGIAFLAFAWLGAG
jgi:hypothetical protein